MSIKTEKNLYQKYDDLFDEQDKKYDQNNHDRYATKKNVRSEDVEYQRYEPKKDSSRDVSKMVYIAIAVFTLSFGLIIYGVTNVGSITKIPTYVIFGIVAVVFSIIKKKKRK